MKTFIITFLLLFCVFVSLASSYYLSPYFFGPISKGGPSIVAGDKLLLESGDYVLLETGTDKILLE